MSIISTSDLKDQQQSVAAGHVSQSGRKIDSQAAAVAVQAAMKEKINPIQRQPEDEDLVQGKFVAQRQPEDEDLVQGKFPMQRQSESSPPAQASGIPKSVQSSMEKTLNTDLSDVKVHPNSSKAVEVGAMAYTQGTDIHVAPGHYNPGSSSGKKLLGHELTHVAQQMAGRVQPTGSVSGLPLNDSPSLEQEADSMGSKVK